ncbi:MAG: VanZ family protein, partial [Lachnospiraceae bacterium]|nr:VanZ family protein [Lachnospiraceae bacterium]
MIWINSIWEGSKLFGVCVLPVYLAAVVLVSLLTKKWNYVKALVMGFFLYYLCCVFALVFLPLQSQEEAFELSYQVELMPLHCISDIAKTPLRGTLVVIFNILMTIPFGMFLRYYFG